MVKEANIILTSGKCAWGKCIGCGWGKIEGPAPDIHRLKKDIDEKFKKLKGIDRLKIFSSGSFLDEKQFPRAIRKYVAQKCAKCGIKELVIESRTEFITEEALKDFKGVKLTVAIGLEAADNKVLKRYRKGFTVEDYARAAEILKKNRCGLRTYLMVGLPWVKNLKKSLKKSVEFARKYSDSIVLINVFPHVAAPLHELWVKGKWKPLNRTEFEKVTKDFKDCEKEFDNFAFVPKFKEKAWIKGAGEKELLHPYFEVWQDYINRFWEPPRQRDMLLFIPCAYRKPYYKSKLHKAIFSVLNKLKIKERLQLVVISSPGVIPYEFANFYPFNKYDWPEWEETTEIKKKYIKVTRQRVYAFLKSHGKHYKKVFCYFKPDSESYIALKGACNKAGIKLIDCLRMETYEKIRGRKNPLACEEALKDLHAILSVL